MDKSRNFLSLFLRKSPFFPFRKHQTTGCHAHTAQQHSGFSHLIFPRTKQADKGVKTTAAATTLSKEKMAQAFSSEDSDPFGSPNKESSHRKKNNDTDREADKRENLDNPQEHVALNPTRQALVLMHQKI
ncbi:uncharacterized protein LOC120183247 [Hibiscus syriacus]|uniref:uncharacterized protein LOC120183247 n=1 Tax=Hibiscus syriacus TaxID=106335 RepID=UPI0019215325|nr:uncharacterized protein LOC120183247 [Hibiscus syriacus]